MQTGTARKCGDKGEKKGDFIPKGEVRIGVINVETGTCVKFFAMSSSQTSLLFFNSSTVLLHSFVPSHSLALSCALLTVSRIGILFSLFKKVRINVLALRSVTSAFGSWGEFCFFLKKIGDDSLVAPTWNTTILIAGSNTANSCTALCNIDGGCD